MIHSSTRAYEPRAGRTRASRGFTMVELMLVVVLLGLVTTMVSVSYDAMVPGERLNTTVRELAAAIQGARTEAVSRNAEFYIEYDLDQHRYRLITPFRRGGGMWVPELESEDERHVASWEYLRPGVEFAEITLAGRTYTDNPPLWVRFDPLGAASDHQILLVQPAYENYFTIEVLALTGLVRMHDGVFEREYPDERDFD
ncbi:MAG: GspH/FimT family protein [Planctomycetota bacterium]|nr:GspH/FimT family protein [Planctomycetota bacterium]